MKSAASWLETKHHITHQPYAITSFNLLVTLSATWHGPCPFGLSLSLCALNGMSFSGWSTANRIALIKASPGRRGGVSGDNGGKLRKLALLPCWQMCEIFCALLMLGFFSHSHSHSHADSGLCLTLSFPYRCTVHTRDVMIMYRIEKSQYTVTICYGSIAV